MYQYSVTNQWWACPCQRSWPSTNGVESLQKGSDSYTENGSKLSNSTTHVENTYLEIQILHNIFKPETKQNLQ
jgi:hypothetical protein